jgi:hypothetical protein
MLEKDFYLPLCMFGGIAVLITAAFFGSAVNLLLIPIIIFASYVAFYNGSDLYWKRHHEQKALDETHARLEASAPVRQLWNDDPFRPPPVDEFMKTVDIGYQHKCLHITLYDYHWQKIAAVQRTIYEQITIDKERFTPLQVRTAVTALWAAFVDGFVAFTMLAPPGIQRPKPAPTDNALFTVEKDLDDYIHLNGEYLPQGKLAYEALAKPFREEKDTLTILGFDHKANTYLEKRGASFDTEQELLNIAREDDNLEWAEKLLARKNKERDKFNEQQVATVAPLQWPFINTPYWPHYAELMPYVLMPERFDIDPKRWFEGTWIVAPPGRGKTNLLRHLILHHLPNASVIIMDAKGDLLQSFSEYAPIKDRLVFLSPDEEFPLAINPLQIGGHSTEFLEYIFQLLNTEMTTNQSTLLSLVLTLCAEIPDANLETFRDILQNGWKKYDPYVRKLKKRDQDFFDLEWDTQLYKSRRPEVLARLRALMATPALDEMLQSTEIKVDMGALMDAGKVVLINNNYELLGDKGSEFFGRMFIALVWAAARKRSQSKDPKRPVFFFIDEAHLTISNDTKVATILQQCRSQKIAMVFAHQELQQIKNDDVKAALSNCAIKFANTTGEASQLAPRLNTTKEFFEELKQGQFATFVLDKTRSAVAIQVPLVNTHDDILVDFPRLTDAEFESVLARSRSAYCYQNQDAHHQPEQRPNRDEPDRDNKYDDRYDMFAEIPLSPRKAREGTVLRIVLPNNREHLEPIQPGTQDGHVFRVKGASTVARPDGTCGNYWVELRIAAMPGSKKEDWDV